jgi:hypothetical protein
MPGNLHAAPLNQLTFNPPFVPRGFRMMLNSALGSIFTRFGYCVLFFTVALFTPRLAAAQSIPEPAKQAPEPQGVSTSSPQSPSSDSMIQPSAKPVVCGPAHLLWCLRDIAKDQAGIWTSPVHLKSRDMFWLLPFAGATAVAIHYDAQAQQQLGSNHSTIHASNVVSQFGAPYTVFGETAALYAFGRFTHNDRLAETGRLGAEAIIDATLVSEALKLATNRERPDAGNGTGGFWSHGTRNFSDSFPSGHAIESWALARVVASEYPSKLSQFGVYALATAVSVSRVTSRRHFPSDALVGSVFGYLIGGYVVHHHSADSAGLGFSVLPTMDVQTHSYGASIEFRPGQVFKLGAMFKPKPWGENW